MNEIVTGKNMVEVNRFRHKLEMREESFILESEIPAEKVYLQFEGVLEGVAVVWHACVQTVKEYSKNSLVDEDPKQFINIEKKDGLYKLEVALNIKQIDQPALERTIIMIRKYKRLSVGYHEYGPRSKTE